MQGRPPRARRRAELSPRVRRGFDEAEGKAGRDKLWKILAGKGVRVAV